MSELSLVVTGTLAIDQLGRYPGRFARFGEVRNLNVSMQLDALESSFGGCAMNVCYTLRCFGAQALPVVRAGRDFCDGYQTHLERIGMDTRGILVDDECAWSSRCIVLSDADGNQLTAFFAGASAPQLAALRPQRDAAALAQDVGARFALVAPDVAPTMIRQARSLMDAGIPAIIDPGQGLADFSPAAAAELLRCSRRLVCNEHEWLTLQRLLGATEIDVVRGLDWAVVTHGAAGVRLLTAHGQQHVPAVAPQAVIEHTGCGDAFRAGLLVTLAAGCNLHSAARVGALAATFKLESPGCQNHWFTPMAFAQRYERAWQASCPLPGYGVATGAAS